MITCTANLRSLFSKIAVFCGGPSHTRQTLQLISAIRKKSPSAQFYGAISQSHSNELVQSYGNSDQLASDPFDRTRDHTEVVSDSIVNPFRTLTHLKNNKFVDKMVKSNFIADLHSKKISAFLTVGNFSLANRIYEQVNQFYRQSNALRPFTFTFDQMYAYRTVDNEQLHDFIFYNLPKKPANINNYHFPSMCIGYEGVYHAMRHLSKFKANSVDSSYPFENFAYKVTQQVNASRSEFRTARGISEDKYIFLTAPGNTANQVSFSIKVLKESLNMFASKSQVKHVVDSFFELFVLIPDETNPSIATQIQNSLTGIPSKFKVTFISEKNKYEAMCASDYGLFHNGEITVEAATCQLPATVIDSMSNSRAYITYLFNGLASPLNVSTDYEGYQDLLGSMTANPYKVSSAMIDHFERPKLRFHYARLYSEHLQLMLKRSGYNPQMNLENTGIEASADYIQAKIQLYSKMEISKPIKRIDRRDVLGLY